MSTFEMMAPKSMLEPSGRGSGETVAWEAIAVANDWNLGVFKDEYLRAAVRTAVLNRAPMVVFNVESLRAKGELAFIQIRSRSGRADDRFSIVAY